MSSGTVASRMDFQCPVLQKLKSLSSHAESITFTTRFGSMGGGRSQNAIQGRSFASAIGATRSKFALTNGYFGRIGRSGRVQEHRQIFSDDPDATFKEFRDAITRGAIDSHGLADGETYLFADGSRVTARFKSSISSGRSPVIEIWSNHPELAPYQKIHFERNP